MRPLSCDARFCVGRVMRCLARFGSKSNRSIGAMLPESARYERARFEPVLNELSLLTSVLKQPPPGVLLSSHPKLAHVFLSICARAPRPRDRSEPPVLDSPHQADACRSMAPPVAPPRRLRTTTFVARRHNKAMLSSTKPLRPGHAGLPSFGQPCISCTSGAALPAASKYKNSAPSSQVRLLMMTQAFTWPRHCRTS